MRVAIVTSARFHLLDLARELAARGHTVRFYSCVSAERARQAGLPHECYRGLLRVTRPLWIAQTHGPERWQRICQLAAYRSVDRAAARLLGRCDVLIGLSGLCVRTIERARERHGAMVFLERGSRHILSQKDTLERIPSGPRPAVPHFELKRELWGYAHADVVVVASRHAAESFLERGVGPDRLFRNPYGVDLERFPATARPRLDAPTLLYVGTWSKRKGCDLLAQAVDGRRWRLVHVGPMGDAPVPRLLRFEHRNWVRSWELPEVFCRAHIYVHPARDESLNMVQAQALASGLPLVCTDRTGGEDLRDVLEDPDWITVARSGDLESLRAALIEGLAKAERQQGVRRILGAGRAQLSWQAYGRRYHEELLRRLPHAAEKRIRAEEPG